MTTKIRAIRVRAGDNLQAAIDEAADSPGAVELRLEAGATYHGGFVIRARPAGSAITIRTDAADGNFATAAAAVPWVTPDYAEAMPRLESVTTDPVLTCEDGASNIRLFGIDVRPNLQYPDRDLIVFGQDSMTDLAQVPDAITIDRCYVHGDEATGQHRGLLFNVAHGRVSGCYFGNFIERGRDSQAIALWNGPGPIVIENTFLEATGENFLIGGADARIPGLIPSDITIRGCHFYKPLEWIDTCRGSVKNLFELKTGRRVLVDGCVFENNWPDAQDGRGLVITVRSQDNTNPWATIADVAIQYSILKNIKGAAISTLGIDDRPGVITQQGTNLLLDNLLVAGCRNGIMINCGFQPTIVRHCTADQIVNWFLQFTAQPIPPGLFTFENNVVPTGQYAIVGDGTGIGAPTLEAMAPDCHFSHNVIEQQNSYRIPLPPDNYELEAGAIAANLDDGHHYTGPEASTTGQPMGADPDAIRMRIPWA